MSFNSKQQASNNALVGKRLFFNSMEVFAKCVKRENMKNIKN